MSKSDFSTTTQDMLDLYDDLEEEDGRGGPLLLALAVGLIIIFGVLVLYGYRDGRADPGNSIPWVAADPTSVRTNVDEIEIRRPFEERATSLNNPGGQVGEAAAPRQIQIASAEAVSSENVKRPGVAGTAAAQALPGDTETRTPSDTDIGQPGPGGLNIQPGSTSEGEIPAPLIDSGVARILPPVGDDVPDDVETGENTPIKIAQPAPGESGMAAKPSVPVTSSPAQLASAEKKPTPNAVTLGRGGGNGEPPRPAAVSRLQMAGNGNFSVQVASLKSDAAAKQTWAALEKKYASLLSGTGYEIQTANLGAKGVFHRLLVGDFASKVQAGSFCARLKRAGQDCLVRARH